MDHRDPSPALTQVNARRRPGRHIGTTFRREPRFMHELAVSQALLTQVDRVARQHGGAPVRRVVLRWGPLSGVEPELLRRAYEVARAGGIASEATLEIERMPVRVECRDCGVDREVPAQRLVCPVCGSWRTRVVSGTELLLQRVELDAPAAAA